jgi:hypothetical protein
MHVNNYSLPKPPDEVLARCTEVLIGDPAFKIKKMRNWCYENDLLLVWWELVDTSDVDYNYHHIAAFYFGRPADATAFALKFK